MPGRRQFLLFWFCIVYTLYFIHDCQLHTNLLSFSLQGWKEDFKYLGTTLTNQNSIQ